MRHAHQRQATGGFSATEMLVVFGLVALMLMIALPSFVRYQVRARVTGAARDVMQISQQARMQAINSHAVAGFVVHAGDTPDEFTPDARYGSRDMVIVFLDINPANRDDPNNGNGHWDSASGERVIRTLELPKRVRFGGPGSVPATQYCDWAMGDPQVATSRRVLFDATGALARPQPSDPIVYLRDDKGNSLRLRFNRITAAVLREKNADATGSAWLAETTQGSWPWTY